MENVCTICGHLEYFTTVCNTLQPFSNVVVIWYIFPCFGILCQEKSGNPEFVRLEVHRMENVCTICGHFGIFYNRLEYFTAI
jgi:hypothetical protein